MKAKPLIPMLGLTGLLAVSFSFVHLLNQDPVDFNAEIRPIINTQCIVCHGGVKQSGGFSLLFREDALSKAKSGKLAIVQAIPKRAK